MIRENDFHEVWWIWSDQSHDYGGLRVAHFHKTMNGTLIFMISDEPLERRGIRIWDDISAREGWTRIAQIAVPTPEMIIAAHSKPPASP
jgi:hypothetical protein